MLTAEYRRLSEYETWYWWYSAQRANLIGAMAQLNLPAGARVLDVGCGTGRNLIELVRALSVAGFGVDVSPQAAALWNGDGRVHRCVASSNDLPYGNGTFDAAASVDALGCRGVDVPRAVSEMARVVRTGGHLVLLVPAYQWMLAKHDAAVHSVHRFTRKELRALARQAGLSAIRITHRFPFFFPFIASVRLVRRAGRKTGTEAPGSDLRVLPRWINGVLTAAARTEHALLRYLNVPFGSTILLIAKKDGS